MNNFQNFEFPNFEIEMLECVWEQFPHIQKSRYWEKSKYSAKKEENPLKFKQWRNVSHMHFIYLLYLTECFQYAFNILS